MTPPAPSPVGVRVLPSAGACTDTPVYQGVSYCDAVRRAGEGETLRVLPGSIQVCRWAPVVLGLEEPQGRFERGLSPRLAYPVPGLLLAPWKRFPGEPDVVVVRGTPAALQQRIQAVGRGILWDGHEGRLDRSALPALAGARASRRGLIHLVNRVLAVPARFAPWQTATRWLFRSRLVSVGFDAVIAYALADMSVCRNSTAIPLLTGRVNVSFFCTGGITWGRNQPGHLTSGWPTDVIRDAMCK